MGIGEAGTNITPTTDFSMNKLDAQDISVNTIRLNNQVDLSGDIIPTHNNVSIGSEDNPIKDLYVSENSLHIGSSHKITVSNDGERLEFLKINRDQQGNVTTTEPDAGVAGSVNNSEQSFFDILTQQPNKFKSQGTPEKTSGYIDISWNYDDIIANQTTSILAKLSFESLAKNKNIPFINQLKLDISGNSSYNSGTNAGKWVSLHTFTINNSDDYNTDSFKTYRLNKTQTGQENQSDVKNILSKIDPFDVRVYGLNFAEDHPTVLDRALIYQGLTFQASVVPAAPLWQNYGGISNDNSFTVTYNVSETENGNASSTAIINQVVTDYSQNDTYASAIYPLDNSVLNDTETISVGKIVNFTLTLSNLRAATKYTYKSKVKNNINSGFSDYSDLKLSDRLRLPNDNGTSNTTITLTRTTTNTVTTPTSTANLNNATVSYIQTSGGSGAFTGSFNMYNSVQTIQITKPDVFNKIQPVMVNGLMILKI